MIILACIPLIVFVIALVWALSDYIEEHWDRY